MSISGEADPAVDPLTIAFDRVTERLTHAESTLAEIEPLSVYGNAESEQFVNEDPRISVRFDDADRRIPKRAPAHGRTADAVVVGAGLGEQDLRHSFDNCELELVVQPELDPDTLEVESVEARVSLRQPDGRIATVNALEVLEQSDLIVRIGDWALRSAIEMAARWHRGTWPTVRVAINVASAQLVDSRFVERVKTLLEDSELPPRCIEIGLTDTVLRNATAVDALRQLRMHGMEVALNDFGASYSSLESLQRMPLTKIKLDRRFANDIEAGARLSMIASNVMRWAGTVGLQVVGIQRPEQLAHALREGSACVLRHYICRDSTREHVAPFTSQQEWALSYRSRIAFRESFVLNEIASGEHDVASRRASMRAD